MNQTLDASRASKYVVGLAFDTDGQNVLLIEKDHPEWQAGKLNGLGGHVEEGETVWQAMAREFKEECGVNTDPGDWEVFLVLEGADYNATFLRLFNTEVLDQATTTTSEQVVVFPTLFIEWPTVANLRWIAPLGADKDIATPVRVFDNNIAAKGR